MSGADMTTCPKCSVEVPAGDLHGIEVPGVYDGVLIWRHHGECGHTWPRFPPGRLHDEAVRLIERGEEVES